MQNKTLLAKIVGLVAVMCLALAMVFGLVGCGGKTVSKTSIENGHLIVTYSDNTTEDLGAVIGPKGDKGDQGEQGKVNPCEHVNKFLMNRVTLEDYNWMVGNNEDEIEATGEDFCYFELYVCKDCGFVTVEFETKHDYEETETAPTCEEAGLNGLKCKKCGYVSPDATVIPALGHDFKDINNPQFAIDYAIPNVADRNFCEDGGFVIYECNRCSGLVKPVDGIGHQCLDWKIIDVIENNKVVKKLAGTCIICEKDVVINFEFTNEDLDNNKRDLDHKAYDAYVSTYETVCKYPVVEITVERNGEEKTFYILNDKYAYEEDVAGKVYVAAEGDVFVDCEVVFVPVAEKAEDGENVEFSQTLTQVTYKGHFTSDNKEYLFGASIDKFVEGDHGIELAAGSELTCKNYVSAGFTCKECEQYVIVNVKADHEKKVDDKGNVIYTYGSDCETATFECVLCEQNIVDAQAHDYEYTIKEGTIVTINNKTTATIQVKCKNCTKVFADLENQTVTGKVTQAAKCDEEGVMTYTFTKGGKDATATAPIAKVNHTFVGSYIEDGVTKNVTKQISAPYAKIENNEGVPYTYGVYGFDDTADEHNCGDTFNQTFTCSACKKTVIVKVIDEHQKPANAPTTCGTHTFTCERCHIENIEYTIPHEYKVISHNRNLDETYNLILECTKCTASDIEDEEEAYLADLASGHKKELSNVTKVSEETIEEPTCEKEGKAKITVKKDYVYTFEVVVEKAAHTYNGKAISSTEPYLYNTPGLELAAGTDEETVDCTHFGEGFFKCDVCHKNAVVRVKGTHKDGDNTMSEEATSATCDLPAYKTYTCSACLKTIYVIEAGSKALGHDYDFNVDADNKKVTITCKNEGCNLEAIVIDYSGYTEDKFVVQEEDPTCGVDGYHKVTLKDQVDGYKTYKLKADETGFEEAGVDKLTVVITDDVKPATGHNYGDEPVVISTYKVETETITVNDVETEVEVTYLYELTKCIECGDYVITRKVPVDN